MKKFVSIFLVFISISFYIICQQQKILPNLNSSYTFNANEINNIKIETTYENLHIKEIFGQEFSIEIYGNNNLLFPIIKTSENTITINSTNKKTTPGDICNIILYLPSEVSFNEIEIKTGKNTKNQINITNLKSNQIIIETINSDIFGQFVTGNLKIQSVNGNIDFSNLDTKNSSFLSKNGNISLNFAKFDQISAISESNSIKIENLEGEYLLLQNKIGNIICDNISVDYFDVKNDSGQTSLSLKQTPTGSSFIKSNTGFVQFFIPITQDFSLNIHSTKGTFFNKLDKSRNTPRHDFRKDYNNGGAEISIKTFSGDIEVDRY